MTFSPLFHSQHGVVPAKAQSSRPSHWILCVRLERRAGKRHNRRFGDHKQRQHYLELQYLYLIKQVDCKSYYLAPQKALVCTSGVILAKRTAGSLLTIYLHTLLLLWNSLDPEQSNQSDLEDYEFVQVCSKFIPKK